MKILLLGDMSPTKNNFEYFDKMDVDTLFSDTQQIFHGNDYVVLNLETAITEHDEGIVKFGPCLKTPLNTGKTLKKVGVTHCSLSNNHIFDFGEKGLDDTIKALEDAGLEYTGIGANYEDSRKNLVLEKNGETVCIISVCEHEYSYARPDRMGARPYDIYDTPADIREAKSKYDKVVVIFHGGKEHCRYPSPRLLKTCRALVDNGADVVLCQHSHCIGCHEIYNGSHILYGQGNFHFVGFRNEPGWPTGMAVTYDTETGGLDFTFCAMNDKGIELAKGELKETLAKEFDERNEQLKNGQWLKGWHDFCMDVKRQYINQFKDVFASCDPCEYYNYVGHALDCEAHHDVIVELFPTSNSAHAQNEKENVISSGRPLNKLQKFVKKIFKI